MTELIVRVPPETPPDARLFLAGDDPLLGPWRADGLPLQRRSEGVYVGQIDMDDETHLDYLITRGSWRLVESHSAGLERGARWMTGGNAGTIDIRVANWGRHSLRYHHSFGSVHLSNTRTVSVYLPPGYDRNPTRRYPVFYMHDGQNLFDAASAFGGVPWGVDETAERLVRARRIQPAIIVGIANSKQRLREYGPTGRTSRGTSRSFRYGRFVVEEVKPFIDRTYRTAPGKEQTAVGGSSMGGLISLFFARWYPEVFGMCMAMSPSLWWDRDLYLRKWPENESWMSGTRFWIDMGDEEAGAALARRQHVRRAKRLAEMLQAGGLQQGRDLRFLEVHGGHHNERDWGERFEATLEFFFGEH